MCYCVYVCHPRLTVTGLKIFSIWINERGCYSIIFSCLNWLYQLHVLLRCQIAIICSYDVIVRDCDDVIITFCDLWRHHQPTRLDDDRLADYINESDRFDVTWTRIRDQLVLTTQPGLESTEDHTGIFCPHSSNSWQTLWCAHSGLTLHWAVKFCQGPFLARS